jgi:glucokinase
MTDPDVANQAASRTDTSASLLPSRGPLPTAIGVDIGASRLKLTLVDQAGNVLKSTSGPTPRHGSGAEVVEGVAAQTGAFRDCVRAAGFLPAGIGVDVPHMIEGEQWIQRWANSLPAIDNLALRPMLADRLGGPMAMTNDATAAAIAEHMFGRGRDVDRLLLMAIGTGISIGVIADGRVLDYNWGTAGDTGQIIVDTAGLHECSCGAHGCLETVASGTGIAAELTRAVGRGEKSSLGDRLEGGQTVTARDVADAARAGDAVAGRIFERAAFFIGVALATYVHLYRPHLIVLAGGVMNSSDLLLEDIQNWLQRLASPARLAGLRGIEMSAFPDLGASIGSASLVLFPGRYTGEPSREVMP